MRTWHFPQCAPIWRCSLNGTPLNPNGFHSGEMRSRYHTPPQLKWLISAIEPNLVEIGKLKTLLGPAELHGCLSTSRVPGSAHGLIHWAVTAIVSWRWRIATWLFYIRGYIKGGVSLWVSHMPPNTPGGSHSMIHKACAYHWEVISEGKYLGTQVWQDFHSEMSFWCGRISFKSFWALKEKCQVSKKNLLKKIWQKLDVYIIFNRRVA